MGVEVLLQFDNPTGQFTPGQIISGNVVISSTSSTIVTGLTLSFHGEGNVYWSETTRERNFHTDHGTFGHRHHHNSQPPLMHHLPSPVDHGTLRHHHHHHHHRDSHHHSSHHQHRNDEFRHINREYRNQETYLNSLMTLPIGHGMEAQLGREIELPAGYCQQIPFAFQLPLSLPSSCKLSHGKVEYFAEAALKVKHSLLVLSVQSSKTSKRLFEIVGLLELPLINDVLNPVNLRVKKVVGGGCCCCTTVEGEFEMNLHLARTGFTLGETIIFQLHYTNGTRKTIKSIKTYLIQTINFITFGKEKTETNNVSETVHIAPIFPDTNGTWNGELRLPPTAHLTDLGGCRIIQIRYQLLVKAKLSVFRKAVVETPITVGTMH